MRRYQLLILLLTPIIVLYTFIRALKFKDYRYFVQRLSFIHFVNKQQEKPIWFHAASVGEVIAIIPLLQEIIKYYPRLPIVLTTNTTTSAEIINKQFNSTPMLQHYYMPVDWKWAIQKTLKTLQPKCLFVVETEIWPNLFSISNKNNVPVVIINARLSHRTTSAKPWLLHLYKKLLRNVTLILARSPEDYESYLKLGAQESRLKIIGNIKFATINDQNMKPILIEHPYVLAASTHDDEELQLTSLWMNLIKNKIVTNEVLVIVPRHPDRTSTIIQQIKSLNANIAVRSKNETITNSTQVYIADTVGELKQFMVNAKFIFMGGSLISHGGQNIIEPAKLGKAIIFGQYMYNFKNECKILLENNAAIQVNNESELHNVFAQLLQEPNKVTQLSELAAKTIKTQEGNILQNYLSEIKKYINPAL